MTHVLVTRTLRAAERERARQLGLQVNEVEVLEIEPVPGLLAEWRNCRRTEAECSDAWIFTSRHAAAALASLLHAGAVARVPPCRAVGPGTASALMSFGVPCSAGPGTGAELGRQIVAEGSIRRALHWRGDEVVGTLAQTLRAAGIVLDEWVVYRKRPRPVTLDLRPYSAVLVFSPSGVRALAAGLSGPAPDGLRFVAIGPTTADEVGTVFARRAVVPAAPDVAAMLECAA